MSETETPTILEYYQGRAFNPVPIPVEEQAAWEAHTQKRRNLYENHLKVPLPMFKDRSVVEFGCNSGENPLYLASIGAKLTLVEPNEQVLPRLNKLFKKFRLEGQVVELVNKDIAGFSTEKKFDLMLAEGFLTMIPNRADNLKKICGLIKPGGFGVISYDDRFGSLFEVTKQLILKRACSLKGIENFQDKASLAVAKELFEKDYLNINASRPFDAWWEDSLLNPYVAWEHLGTFIEFLDIIDEAGCEFHSSSPNWSRTEKYAWYKNILDKEQRHKLIREDFHRAFPFFLTGQAFSDKDIDPASDEVIESASEFIKSISDYTFNNTKAIEEVVYPQALSDYFEQSRSSSFRAFSKEMKNFYDQLKSLNYGEVVKAYRATEYMRTWWGVTGPYISFKKL